MRQILLNHNGAVVAHMPRPSVGPGSVLVRTHYSLISAGTEIAALTPPVAMEEAGPVERAQAFGSLAARYLGKAARDPRRAMRRLGAIAMNRVRTVRPRKAAVPSAPVEMGALVWHKVGGGDQNLENGTLRIVTDTTPFGYQSTTDAVPVPKGHAPVVEVRGEVEVGAVTIGLLSGSSGSWIGSTTLETGVFDERLTFDATVEETVVLVVANAGTGVGSRLRLDSVAVSTLTPVEGMSHDEMGQVGWGTGYSLVGEVIEVGTGVDDFTPGDLVACAGAGQANHADYVSVARNLVCRVPKGCDPRWAATVTVGAIALQGIRRAAPQLAERVSVIGLGLIGQLSVQLLRAAGCRVFGMDLDAARVERALSIGMDSGTTDAEQFQRMIDDGTGGHGVDKTLITAASRSSDIVNLAMETTRRKGTVVVVGDVGLDIARSAFYRKEIDLLMSTSYGPGRYDPTYEINGIDYPFAYVRWTERRNMESYLELVASGRVDVETVIDRIVPVDEAPGAYKELAEGDGPKHLGVLIHYPEPKTPATDADATVVTLRGHRKPQAGRINYALVGAGAFGTSMLVPEMERLGERFFLKAVVSHDTVRGGNFARGRGVEILAAEPESVMANPDIDLAVIATRHHLHSRQVVDALRAGKHVFVEKPLVLSWEELDAVSDAYAARETDTVLMVGFNRRFAPALQTLKEALSRRRSPLVVNYRLNGGFIPADNWIQGAEGGGRNVGEACHMYDVFRFLADAPVSSISATAIDPADTAYLRNDNFVATITYEDGSIGNLVYTAMGPTAGLSKERIEVFADGAGFIIDDFKSLHRAGDSAPLWQTGEADKGHVEELRRLGDSIADGGGAPIPFDEIVETSAVALQVEDQLFGRA